MANLKEVRSRIASVNSTKQITAAMKMVSAAKLRRAQDAIVRMRPYAEKLGAILSNVSASLDPSEGVYAKPREVKRVLLVAITSNRGLCGAFNNQVIRLTRVRIKQLGANAEVKVMCIGKKSNDNFKRLPEYAQDLPRDLAKLFDDLTFTNVGQVAQLVMDRYASGDFDRVELIYNKFKNAATQIVIAEQFLPIAPAVAAEGTTATGSQHAKTDHIMEPDRQTIVKEVVPRSLKIQFYKALLDSHAAEHGARMTAMHKATDNANDLLKELKLSYNKARQAAITGEILEIVGGAEALKG